MKPDESESYRYYSKIMGWADEQRKLLVRTNADQPDQAENAIAWDDQRLAVNGEAKVRPLRAPTRVSAAAFDAGGMETDVLVTATAPVREVRAGIRRAPCGLHGGDRGGGVTDTFTRQSELIQTGERRWLGA